MKITKQQLRRIIREAKYQILNENVENEITFKVKWYLRRVIRAAVSEYVEGPITVNADDLIKYGGKDPRGLALVWGKKENERGSYNMGYQARFFERRDITMSDDEEKRVKKWMFDTYEKLGHVPEDVEAIAAERERLYWEEYAKKERQREERAKKRKLKKIPPMSFKAKFQNLGSRRSVVKDITISAKDLMKYGEDDDARGLAIWWAKNNSVRGRYEPDEVTIDDRDKVEDWMNDIYETLGL